MFLDLIEKKLQTAKAEYARQLVARSHDCGRAVRQERLEVFERPRIMADVGMAINKSGRDKASRCISNLGCDSFCIPRTRSDVAYPTVENRDLHPIENLSRIDIDDSAARDNEIGFNFSHRAANESRKCIFGKCHDLYVT